MYLFKACYFRPRDRKRIFKSIEVDGCLYDNVVDIYTEAMRQAVSISDSEYLELVALLVVD